MTDLLSFAAVAIMDVQNGQTETSRSIAGWPEGERWSAASAAGLSHSVTSLRNRVAGDARPHDDALLFDVCVRWLDGRRLPHQRRLPERERDAERETGAPCQRQRE